MGFYDKARGMGHYYAGMQHHPVNTIHDGDEKVGKLIDALPGDEQQSFRERLAAIPRTFSASAEQTEILNQFRSLYDELMDMKDEKQE